MAQSVRLFIAAQLPDSLKTYLATQRQAYEHPAIRMVPEQNLHLTLFFIGNVPVTEVSNIREKLAEVAERHQPFTLALEQLEPGPTPQSPRLIWARFRQHETFIQLSRHLTYALSPASPRQEKSIPHVTLCRFRKDLPKPPPFQGVVPNKEIQYHVSSLALWSSQLASPHPVYTVEKEYVLGA